MAGPEEAEIKEGGGAYGLLSTCRNLSLVPATFPGTRQGFFCTFRQMRTKDPSPQFLEPF